MTTRLRRYRRKSLQSAKSVILLLGKITFQERHMSSKTQEIKELADKLLSTINRKFTRTIDLQHVLGERGWNQLTRLIELCVNEDQQGDE